MADTKAYEIGGYNEPRFNNQYRVLEHAVLNFNSIEGNNNKFYSIELQESSEGFRIFTHYGRVGAPGKKEGRYILKQEFKDDTKEIALKEFNKILNSKKKKGYVPLDMALLDIGSGKIQSHAPSQTSSNSRCSIDQRIQDLVRQVYQEASQSLSSIIRTPLGALSESQIGLGFKKLSDIRQALSCRDSKKLIELSSQFYSLVPQKFSHRIGLESVIDSEQKADKQEEILQLMRDVYSVKGSLESEIEAKYKAINAQIEPLGKSDSEYSRVEYKIESTHSPHHPVRLYVNNVFRLQVNSVKGKFNPNKLSCLELFHGSASRNILGIMQRGLLIAPQNVSHNGAAFGRGIYFARHSTKSSQYSTGFHSSLGNNAFLFLADVAVGKMQKIDRYTWSHTLKSGYNSVFAQAGADLIHDEYIVYNTNQSEIKYVVDFTAKPRRGY
jgi:poly [ADP-ribose] polymerase 2/3/4